MPRVLGLTRKGSGLLAAGVDTLVFQGIGALSLQAQDLELGVAPARLAIRAIGIDIQMTLVDYPHVTEPTSTGLYRDGSFSWARISRLK